MRTSERKHQTLASRLGFDDPDLKDPKHDDLTIQAAEILGKPRRLEIDQAKHEQDFLKFKAEIIDAVQDYSKTCRLLGGSLELLVDFGKAVDECEHDLDSFDLEETISGIHLEYPICKGTGKYKTVVGFADLVVESKMPIRVALYCQGYKRHRLNTHGSCFDIDGCDNLFEMVPYFQVEQDSLRRIVEVKSHISELGGLLRQINLYREFVDGEYIVACPDNRYEKILKSQGIGFLHLTGTNNDG